MKHPTGGFSWPSPGTACPGFPGIVYNPRYWCPPCAGLRCSSRWRHLLMIIIWQNSSDSGFLDTVWSILTKSSSKAGEGWGGISRMWQKREGRVDSSSPSSLATSCRDPGAREVSWIPTGSSLNCSCPASPPASTLQLKPSWTEGCSGIGLLGFWLHLPGAPPDN